MKIKCTTVLSEDDVCTWLTEFGKHWNLNVMLISIVAIDEKNYKIFYKVYE